MKNIDKWITDYIHEILMLDEECQIGVLIDDVCSSVRYSCDYCPLQDTCDNEDETDCFEDLRKWAMEEYHEV